MVVAVELLLASFKALGDPTRLRIALILRRGEFTTTELCGILSQTQPRVSRHLKLLVEAGLLTRFAEGSKAFYRAPISGASRELLEYVAGHLEPGNLQLLADRERLEQVRAERSSNASKYFSALAADWDQVRALHVPDDKVEAALLDIVGQDRFGLLLDIGTGTGRMLELFADKAAKAVGIDNNTEMLNVARSNLDRPELQHCTVRKSSAYGLDNESSSVDVVVIHQVLHFLEDPQRSISEASRVLRPEGQLLVVDFATHKIERFRTDHNHHRLGFSNRQMKLWFESAGLVPKKTVKFASDKRTAENLTVVVWSASRP